MNFKRILSSALVVIMLFSAITLLIPVNSKAAHHSSADSTRLTDDQVKDIVNEYSQATYASAEEMFQADKSRGHLDYSTNGTYSVYINRYTGVAYYRNEKTGEMLTSNTYNFNGVNVSTDASTDRWASQVRVNYSKISDSTASDELTSNMWAALKNQITVTKINNGLRVSYAIGNTATRCLLPVLIEAREFENDILRPMFDKLYEEMRDNMGEEYALNFFGEDSDLYDEEAIYSSGTMHQSIRKDFEAKFNARIKNYKNKAKANGASDEEIDDVVTPIENLETAIMTIIMAYQPFNPNSSTFRYNELATPAITLEGYAVYRIKDTDFAQMSVKAKLLQKYCSDYTFEMMYEDEEFCGYEHEYQSNPVFRCALEYTLNDDGTLSVRLPSNSIVFDETEYILNSITPLQYFGAANFQNDGYIFIPDGSGSIIDFEDFRYSSVSLSSSISFYGNDYCYSKISGAHNQPLTMPVYGIASTRNEGGNKVSLGYFAILEEGSSMAAMNVIYNSDSKYKEGAVFTTFTPYPADTFDLSDTISVGSAASYSMVSESKYSGSYVTRYVMLTGDNASYMGMADYYRNYLVKNGTLSALENVSDDLPLYLEALGSLEVVEKILTFPINVNKAITTFEDVATIYEELGRAKERMLEKAEEYDQLAEEEQDNMELKHSYEQTAANYRRLAEEIVNIDNINFKLTGFANGGLYSTYPTKVKWEKSVGGKRGFKKLLKVAKENTDADSNFGIYPEFDFQYISNTAAFDKVGKRNTVSRMVDNRYASKQVYSNITGEFDTIYSMIVSADALDRLYDKFIKKYDNYKDATGISVSTLGSDLNSNFDEDNPVSRDEAQGYVTALLDRIANESNYSVMISQGNIYAVKYADHILNICTDSTYYRYSSYTIPFIGMILHGYVNYAGAPLNYSGSPDYDLLRSIENGASIYYVIGYQNTDIMKDDEEFNKYYSISYENWFDDIVENYSLINAQIGNLQDYKIVAHEVLIGERVVDPDEEAGNLKALMDEFVEQFTNEVERKIDEKLVELRDLGDYSKRIGVSADIDSLVAIAHEMFELDANETLPASFTEQLNKVLADFNAEYDVSGVDPANVVTVSVSTLDYQSKYQYVTGSTARDEDYDHTDYTVDNDLIVMVTYRHDDGRETSFILNYNIYAVEVTLADGEAPYVIEKYGFVRI